MYVCSCDVPCGNGVSRWHPERLTLARRRTLAQCINRRFVRLTGLKASEILEHVSTHGTLPSRCLPGHLLAMAYAKGGGEGHPQPPPLGELAGHMAPHINAKRQALVEAASNPTGSASVGNMAYLPTADGSLRALHVTTTFLRHPGLGTSTPITVARLTLTASGPRPAAVPAPPSGLPPAWAAAAWAVPAERQSSQAQASLVRHPPAPIRSGPDPAASHGSDSGDNRNGSSNDSSDPHGRGSRSGTGSGDGSGSGSGGAGSGDGEGSREGSRQDTASGGDSRQGSGSGSADGSTGEDLPAMPSRTGKGPPLTPGGGSGSGMSEGGRQSSSSWSSVLQGLPKRPRWQGGGGQGADGGQTAAMVAGGGAAAALTPPLPVTRPLPASWLESPAPATSHSMTAASAAGDGARGMKRGREGQPLPQSVGQLSTTSLRHEGDQESVPTMAGSGSTAGDSGSVGGGTDAQPGAPHI